MALNPRLRRQQLCQRLVVRVQQEAPRGRAAAAEEGQEERRAVATPATQAGHVGGGGSVGT